MVRYRQDAGERSGYTFRLNNANGHALTGHNGVIGSNTTLSDRLQALSEHSVSIGHSLTADTSIVYKERIDSLFRDRSHGRNAADTVKADEPTMEHLKIHFQKVLAEQRGMSSSASVASSKNKSTTYIQVHNQANANLPVPAPTVAVETAKRPAAANRSQSFNEARNAVQAQIEKMFQDAAKGSQQPVSQEEARISVDHTGRAVISLGSSPPPPPLPTSPVPHCKQNVPLPPIPTAATVPTPPSAASNPVPAAVSHPNSNKYKVDYLGSLALTGRATSLEALQVPLKDLYVRYRHSLANKLNVFRGTMDISAVGLRIQYYTDWRTTIPVEILNPFPTIAVWAAVKFVCRAEGPDQQRRFAFMPLICDPENQEKHSLFHPLNAQDAQLLQHGATQSSTATVTHPPMFTCVMRKAGAPKTLECHAFVCDHPEDAIVIAANLYQALLRNMKTTDKSAQETAPTTEAPQKVATPPTSTSAVKIDVEPIYSPDTSVSNWSDSSVTSIAVPVAPVRPPRRKKKAVSGGLDAAGLEKRRSIRRTNSKARAAQGKPNLRRSMRSASQRSQRVKRNPSERQLSQALVQQVQQQQRAAAAGNAPTDGDILTKVAIPRSKSFMTVPQNYSIGELFEELKVGPYSSFLSILRFNQLRKFVFNEWVYLLLIRGFFFMSNYWFIE